MTKNLDTSTSMNAGANQSPQETPWWNRKVIGENSLVEQFFSKSSKLEVPDEKKFIYGQNRTDLLVFAKTAQAIDSDKFAQEEFLIFVKLKYLFEHGINEYAGLYYSLRFLQVAIEAKDSFICIDQTELRYRGSKQQALYQFVESLLEDHDNKEAFRQKIQERLSDLLPQVKTEEGKTALQSYAQHLERLSENELGLKLLSLFKTYQLADYSVLRTISDLLQSLSKSNLQDFPSLLSLVKSNYQLFEQLRTIIGLAAWQSTPETYALMIQYIALSHRHAISYLKFDNLTKVMQQWFKPYQAMIAIRQEHPPGQYKQPKEFQEAIPGVEIYEKYKKWLTDKKTGIVYIDFGDAT